MTRKKNNSDYVVVGQDTMNRPVYARRSPVRTHDQQPLFNVLRSEKIKSFDVPHLEEEAFLCAQDSDIHWDEDGKDNFLFALDWIHDLHAGQWRKNRGHRDVTPYVEHPLRCMIRLYRLGIRDGNILTATLLHDSIEDCSDKIVEVPSEDPTEMQENAREVISETISDTVASHVWAVTNHPAPKPKDKQEKRQRYADKLTDLIQRDPVSFTIKISDLHDNASGLQHNLVEGNEGMVKSLHGKYTYALEQLRPYEHHLDQVECGAELRDMLDKIRSNLDTLGRRLEKL